MPLHGSFFTRSIGMSEIDQRLAEVLQPWQQWELWVVVRGNRFEDIVPMLSVLGSDFPERLHDTVWIPARHTDHPVFPSLPLDHRKQGIIVSTFWSDDQICFPVSELQTVIDADRPFLNASSKAPLVFMNPRLFGRASQLLREIDVLYVQEPEISVAIQGFGADSLLPGEWAILQSTVSAYIQRPVVFKKAFFYIWDEGTLFKKIIVAAASLTILLISGLPGFSFVSGNIPPIESDGTAFDLVSDGVRRTADLFCDPIRVSSVFEARLNNDTFFKWKMFTLSVFSCGRMYLVHKVFSLWIEFGHLHSTKEKLYGLFIFTCST